MYPALFTELHFATLYKKGVYIMRMLKRIIKFIDSLIWTDDELYDLKNNF